MQKEYLISFPQHPYYWVCSGEGSKELCWFFLKSYLKKLIEGKQGCWNSGCKRHFPGELPICMLGTRTIYSLVSGLMLLFNLLSSKSFMKFIASADNGYCIACLHVCLEKNGQHYPFKKNAPFFLGVSYVGMNSCAPVFFFNWVQHDVSFYICIWPMTTL